MGNNTSNGFGVLNLSTYKVNIGLSMGGTHYYENGVNHGEIFYRCPGAVHYTVYAQVGPEITPTSNAKEIAGATAVGVVTAAAVVAPVAAGYAAATGGAGALVVAQSGGAAWFAGSVAVEAACAGTAAYGAAKAGGYGYDKVSEWFVNKLKEVDAAECYAEMKGCYGGIAEGGGTWLVLTGGPRVSGQNNFEHRPLKLSYYRFAGKANTTVNNMEYVLSRGSFTRYSHSCFHTCSGLPKAQGHDCNICKLCPKGE